MPVQMFLKLDGIAGESTDPKHKGEIDIQGWSWGLSEPAPSVPQPGVGTGKVSIHDITIQKPVDLSLKHLSRAQT
jgi:type VI secretion system secreted protein Hcp